MPSRHRLTYRPGVSARTLVFLRVAAVTAVATLIIVGAGLLRFGAGRSDSNVALVARPTPTAGLTGRPTSPAPTGRLTPARPTTTTGTGAAGPAASPGPGGPTSTGPAHPGVSGPRPPATSATSHPASPTTAGPGTPAQTAEGPTPAAAPPASPDATGPTGPAATTGATGAATTGRPASPSSSAAAAPARALIRNVGTGGCADLPYTGSNGSGTTVTAFTCTAAKSDNQEYKFVASQAHFLIRNVKSGLCLDAGAAGSDVVISSCTGAGALFDQIPVDGGVHLVDAANGLCLDVSTAIASYLRPDRKLTLGTCSAAATQTWALQ